MAGFDSRHLEAGGTLEGCLSSIREDNSTELAEVRAELERRLTHLVGEDRQILMPVLNENLGLFCNDIEGVLPCTTKGSYEIRTGDALPITKKPYRVPYALREEMRKRFRPTALRPTNKQRSRRNRAEDKLVTLETYGTRYTEPDSQKLHADATEKDITENLTQDPDFDPHHHSSTRTSTYDVTNGPEDRSAFLKYPVGYQTDDYHRDVDETPQVSEGGETMSEPTRTELLGPEPNPNDPPEVECFTDAREKAESTPRYNLRPRPGRKV